MSFSSDILEEYIHSRFTATWEAKRDYLPSLLKGHFHCMKSLVNTGNWVVADAVLEEPALVAEAVKALWDQQAYLVGVHCAPAELERRERERGDRAIGMAVGQLEKVHAHGTYDFTVDTTSTPAATCAARIADFISGSPPPQAFNKLKTTWNIDPTNAHFELDWW